MYFRDTHYVPLFSCPVSHLHQAWGDSSVCLGFSLSWLCSYLKDCGLQTSCFCPYPTPNIQGTSVLGVLSLSWSGPQPSAVSPTARHILHPFPCRGSKTQCLRPKGWIGDSHALIFLFLNVLHYKDSLEVVISESPHIVWLCYKQAYLPSSFPVWHTHNQNHSQPNNNTLSQYCVWDCKVLLLL